MKIISYQIFEVGKYVEDKNSLIENLFLSIFNLSNLVINIDKNNYYFHLNKDEIKSIILKIKVYLANQNLIPNINNLIQYYTKKNISVDILKRNIIPQELLTFKNFLENVLNNMKTENERIFFKLEKEKDI